MKLNTKEPKMNIHILFVILNFKAWFPEWVDHVYFSVKTGGCEETQNWEEKCHLIWHYIKCLEDAGFALFNTGSYSACIWIMQNKQKSLFSKNILIFTLIFLIRPQKKIDNNQIPNPLLQSLIEIPMWWYS